MLQDTTTGRMQALPGASAVTENTLDEPVLDTILRDARRIGVKLGHVVIPRGNTKTVLRDWDLWGPLLLCLTLSGILSVKAPPNEAGFVFAAVFVLVWVGAAVVTLNTQLLGGTVSFFQCVCTLGYSLFPLTVAALLSVMFPSSLLARAIFSLVGLIWSCVASLGFLADVVPSQRKALAVYPIVLFYLTIAWMVLSHQ